jgi:tyrosyl-tRNA synthetase
MNVMVPGLAGGKMSASDPNSKIDLLDTEDVIRKKLKSAFCEEGNIEGNGVLAFVEAVLIPISQLRLERNKGDAVLEAGLGDQRPFVSDDAPPMTVFTIERDQKFGGPTHYESFAQIKEDFKEKRLHPKDLKTTVANGVVRLLAPIRKAFEENEEWQKIEKLAYPDPSAKVEKKRKVELHILLEHDDLTDWIYSFQEKVYHPPPPGKGRNVKPAVNSVAPVTAQATAE